MENEQSEKGDSPNKSPNTGISVQELGSKNFAMSKTEPSDASPENCANKRASCADSGLMPTTLDNQTQCYSQKKSQEEKDTDDEGINIHCSSGTDGGLSSYDKEGENSSKYSSDGIEKETFKTSLSIFDIDDDRESEFCGSENVENHILPSPAVTFGQSSNNSSDDNESNSQSLMQLDEGSIVNKCTDDLSVSNKKLSNETRTEVLRLESADSAYANNGLNDTEVASELMKAIQNQICPILDKSDEKDSSDTHVNPALFKTKSHNNKSQHRMLKNKINEASKTASSVSGSLVFNVEDNQVDDELLLPDKPIVPSIKQDVADSQFHYEINSLETSTAVSEFNNDLLTIKGSSPCPELHHSEQFEKVSYPDKCDDISDEKSSYMQCNMCPPGVILEYPKMQAHINEVHLEKVVVVDEKHVCLPCFKVCKDMVESSIHYHCPICQKSVLNANIIEHVRSHQTNNMPLEDLSTANTSPQIVGNFKVTFVPLYLGEYNMLKHLDAISKVCFSNSNCLLCKETETSVINKSSEKHLEETHLNHYVVIQGIGSLIPFRVAETYSYICPFCLHVSSESEVIKHLMGCGPGLLAKIVNSKDISDSFPEVAHFVEIDECAFAVFRFVSKYMLPSNIINKSIFTKYTAKEFGFLKNLRAGLKKLKGIKISRIMSNLFCRHDKEVNYHVCKLCPDGKDVFQSKNSMEDHLYLKHLFSCVLVKDKWCCLPCHRDCYSKDYTTHYHCPLCHVQFLAKDLFAVHMKEKHDAIVNTPSIPEGEGSVESEEVKVVGLDQPNVDVSDPPKYSLRSCFVKLSKLCRKDILAAGVPEFEDSSKTVDSNESETGNDYDEGIPFNEMVDSDECDLSCKFCTYKTYRDKMDCIESHILTEHWEARVNVFNKYWTIPCFKRCGSMHTVHYHCPVCKTTVYGTEEIFIKHVNRHPDIERLQKPGPKISKILPVGNFLIPEDVRTRLLAESSAKSSAPIAYNGINANSVNGPNGPVLDNSSEFNKTFPPQEVGEKFLPLNNIHSVLEIVDSLDEEGYLELCYHCVGKDLKCRLCYYSCNYADKTLMMNHLKSLHLSEVAIVDQKWLCLPFYHHESPDEVMEYYHCPFCNIAILKKNGFLLHVFTHGVTVSFDLSSLVTKGYQPLDNQLLGARPNVPVQTPDNSVEKSAKVTRQDNNMQTSSLNVETTLKEEFNDSEKNLKKRVVDIPVCSVKPNKRLKISDSEETSEVIVDKITVKENKEVKPKSPNMGRLKRDQIMKLIAKTGKQFRCRLCQDSGYVFKRPDPVIQHLVNVHVTKGVLDRNRLVLPCFLDCYIDKMREDDQAYSGERIHYHCIDCQAIICRKSSFLEHTRKHKREVSSAAQDTQSVSVYPIDESNGLYLSLGEAKPFHFQKVDEHKEYFCEHPSCGLSGGGKMSVECSHILLGMSGSYKTSISNPLRREYLGKVAMSNSCLCDCIKLTKVCMELGVPTIVGCNVNSGTQTIVFSVFTNQVFSWCPLKRVITSLDTKSDVVICGCPDNSCAHVGITRWYYQQIMDTRQP